MANNYLAGGFAQVVRTPAVVRGVANAVPAQGPVIGTGGSPYRPAAVPRQAIRNQGFDASARITGSFWNFGGGFMTFGRYIGYFLAKIAGLELFGVALFLFVFRHGPRDRIRAFELLPLAGIWWLLRVIRRDVWDYQNALLLAARNTVSTINTQISLSSFDPLAGMEAAANAAGVAAANSAANVYGEWGGLNAQGIAAGAAAGGAGAAVGEAVTGIEGMGFLGAPYGAGPTIGIGGSYTGMGGFNGAGAGLFTGPIACSPWGYNADNILTFLLIVALLYSTLTARTRNLGCGWAAFLAFVSAGVALYFLGQCAGFDAFGVFQWTGGSISSYAYQTALAAQAQANAAQNVAPVDVGIGEGVGLDFGIFDRNDPLPMDSTPEYIVEPGESVGGLYYSTGAPWWLFVLYLIAYARPHSPISSTVDWLRLHWAWILLASIAAIITPSQAGLARIIIALRVAYILVAPQGAYSEPSCITAWIRRRNQYERALNIADAKSGSCQPSIIRAPTTRCQPLIAAATSAVNLYPQTQFVETSPAALAPQLPATAVAGGALVVPSTASANGVVRNTVVRSKSGGAVAVSSSVAAAPVMHPVNVPSPCLPCPAAASQVLSAGGSHTAALIAGGAPGMRGVAINATGKSGVTLHGTSGPGVVMAGPHQWGVSRRVTFASGGL